MRKQILFYLIILLSVSSFSQKLVSNTFEEVDLLMTKKPKPILIFLHTDWCKYCRIMEKTTFEDQMVIKKLNSDFYLVFFNPETPNDITFYGHTFKYNATGKNSGTNELAKELGEIDGTTAYPTVCILDENYNIIFQHASLLDNKQLLTILNEIK